MRSALAVSVLGNVVLLCVVFYLHHWRQYCAEMYEDAPRVLRPKFRRYTLVRDDDVSGVSGTGTVCEISEFSDGHAALHWLGKHPLTTPHPRGVKEIMELHGHDGKTRLVRVDEA